MKTPGKRLEPPILTAEIMETSQKGKKRSATELETDDAFPKASPVKKMFPIFSERSGTTAGLETSGSLVWKRKDFLPSTCLFGENLIPEIRPKIAAFDLDGTVIEFLSHSQELEWKFWHKNIQEWLKDAYNAGSAIVFFSNQLYPQKRLLKWREKIGFIAQALGIPFFLFASTARDGYRKPMPGMWVALERLAQEAEVTIDKENSFFVGDAAGRKGDHASTDRKFADNIGLTFFTPEEYFLRHPPQPYEFKGVHVSKLHVNGGPRVTPTSSTLLPSNRKQPEIVLFVGPPASGKTSFFQDVFLPAGYTHVNQDTLGNRPKCLKVAEESLKKGKSCVIDNTNRDKKTRQYYIELAKSLSVPVRCFNFKISRDLAWHNNLYRTFCLPLLSGSLATETKERKLIPFNAFLSFHQAYEEPANDEGLQEVKTVNWQFEGDTEKERYWKMWLQIDGK